MRRFSHSKPRNILSQRRVRTDRGCPHSCCRWWQLYARFFTGLCFSSNANKLYSPLLIVPFVNILFLQTRADATRSQSCVIAHVVSSGIPSATSVEMRMDEYFCRIIRDRRAQLPLDFNPPAELWTNDRHINSGSESAARINPELCCHSNTAGCFSLKLHRRRTRSELHCATLSLQYT